MTALFPSEEEAGAAAGRLGEEGADPRTVRFDPPLPASRPPRPADPGGAEDVLDEVAAAASESFSDDEKLSRRVEKYRRAGHTAISFPFEGDETKRRLLAERLKADGASAVFFWGSWVTEQL